VDSPKYFSLEVHRKQILTHEAITLTQYIELGHVHKFSQIELDCIKTLNSAYVDWKTSLSRFNIAGPKPGKGGGLC
jgi:hypothetical protein